MTKTTKRFAEEDKFADSSSVESCSSPGMSQRRIRSIHPVGLRVVVKIRKDANVSEGGLYLPDGAKENMEESVLAQVIEVASATETDDHSHEENKVNISGIPLGATVLIRRTAGIKVPWDDTLRIVETKEVLALVDEVTLS